MISNTHHQFNQLREVLRDPSSPTSFMNQEQFDRTFQFQPSPKIASKRKKQIAELFNCLSAPAKFFKFIISFFPILSWLPEYEYKQNLLGDISAGLTVGIVHVPQSIAYAILTGVDPVFGLYTSFFGVILYMIFGTSKYVSIGSFAIISLMTGVSCREIYDQIERDYLAAEIRYVDQAHHKHLSFDFNNLTEAVPKIQVRHEELVQLVTLVSGVIQILMGLLRIEFMASYLSDQLVSGFCTGAAVHVVAVQINKLLQVNVAKASGPGYLIKYMFDFFNNLSTTNTTAMIISICSFAFLYVGKDIIGLKLKSKLPAPIPFELLLVIFSTFISFWFNFSQDEGIEIVKNVPIGLPVANFPRYDLLYYVIGPSLEIAFVVVALHLSMCKVFNRKLASTTDNNQELYALGIVATLSSFFNSYPISSSLGRSMLNVECGAKTQLSSLFTAALLLVVILFLGPLLSTLPMCCLAVIIIYSMKGVFQKMPNELAHLFRVARIDFMIWIVTFIATVVLNVMEGLVVSVIFALLTTVFRIQWPRWRILSQLSGTEEYRDCGRYGRVNEIDGVKIFRFDAPLLFINVDHFSKSIDKALADCSANSVGENGLTTLHQFVLSPPPKSAKKLDQPKKKSFVARIFASGKENYEKAGEKKSHEDGIDYLVIDCSGFTFIDYTSISALADIFKRLKRSGISVSFAEAKAPIRDTLECCGFYDTVPKCNFFPTIHDAVLAACSQRRSRTTLSSAAAIDTPKSATDKQHFFIGDSLPSSQLPLSPNYLQIEIRATDENRWDSRKRLDVHDDV